MALLSTIFTVLLLTAIGMAMIYASNMDSMINANYRDKQRAQYASVSGVQEARDRIQPVNLVPLRDALARRLEISPAMAGALAGDTGTLIVDVA